MNKVELNNSLNFLYQPNANIQVNVYAILNNQENPRKLDIAEDDLSGIRDLFLESITNSIINENEHVVLPLSTADERGKCFYEYDIELPDELVHLNEIIGNDNIDLFNFNDEAITQIHSLFIVLGNREHQVSLYKKLSPIEIIGRGSFFLFKSAERFEKFNNNLLRISPGFQAISVNNTVVILNLKTIEKSFGFVEVIKREALQGIEAIRDMAILQNIESLEGLVSNITFARKLIKIAKNSPVIKNGIPNTNIINFTKDHPALRGKIRYNEDETLINLDTKVSKNLFVKLLNDDFLTSELTQLYYDSLAKDDILMEEAVEEEAAE